MEDRFDAAEIEKFSRMSARWWDTEGPFRPLHRLNPARLSYIRDHVAVHFGRHPRAITPFAGLSLAARYRLWRRAGG